MDPRINIKKILERRKSFTEEGSIKRLVQEIKNVFKEEEIFWIHHYTLKGFPILVKTYSKHFSTDLGLSENSKMI